MNEEAKLKQVEINGKLRRLRSLSSARARLHAAVGNFRHAHPYVVGREDADLVTQVNDAFQYIIEKANEQILEVEIQILSEFNDKASS